MEKKKRKEKNQRNYVPQQEQTFGLSCIDELTGIHFR